MQGPPRGGSLHDWGRFFLPLQNEKKIFLKVSFERRFKTPDGIAHRVPGMWVLPILDYLN